MTVQESAAGRKTCGLLMFPTLLVKVENGHDRLTRTDRAKLIHRLQSPPPPTEIQEKKTKKQPKTDMTYIENNWILFDINNKKQTYLLIFFGTGLT